MPVRRIPQGHPVARGRMLVRSAVVAASALGVLSVSAEAATQVGTPGPDTLTGHSPTGDSLFGGGGADVLIGGPGNDQLYGGRAGNTLDGAGGDNYLEGGTGDDVVAAGDGNNTVITGSGHDRITVGNGNNYVDPGGAPDVVTAGNGNNVFNLGSGGADLTAGSGNNTVYYSAGRDHITLGGGINHVWMASTGGIARLDCGGNPASVVHVNIAADPHGAGVATAVASGRIVGCANVATFSGPRPVGSTQADDWKPFWLVGGPGRDKLFGGHGGGYIDGGGGDNVLWADSLQETGGADARDRTTRLHAADGNNLVFGGRGTNLITLGDGDNFVRGGAWNNEIDLGSGSNSVRLQGYGKNHVTLHGGEAYIESFARGPRPRITCLGGAHGMIVYGLNKPKTNCGRPAKARSATGRRLQLQSQSTSVIPESDPVVENPIRPGQGAGIPRPIG